MRVYTSVIMFLALASFAYADRLDQMISPAFHPVTFEDPRSITEARFIYAYHKIDDQFVTGGGNLQVYALELRAAINDRLALLATKDGYVDFNPNETLPKDEGFADIEVGAKYAFYKDAAAGQIASAMLRYTIPTGNKEVLQGKGDGEIHPSLSTAYSLSPQATFTFASGLRIPVDSDFSTFWDFDTQIDYRIETTLGQFYPLVGASAIYILDGGNQLPIADEGQDFFNFGASDADGETIALAALGCRFRPISDLDLGVALQLPFDQQDGNRVIDYRWTFDAIVRF